MTYKYHVDGTGKKQSNRLYHVKDLASGTAATDDIDDQGTFTPGPAAGTALGQINTLNNYSYDEIGNLVKDNQEGIANIDWTVYGKIKEITRTTASTAKNLIFAYDAAGNRISKTSYGNGQPSTSWVSTYYVRDAQGNVMATYDYKPSGPGGSGPQVLNLTEHPIYGSSRVGLRTYNDADNLTASASPYNTSGTTYTLSLQKGYVSYELSNHLGNVITVVSDRKIPVASSSNPLLVDHFVGDLLSSNDYYAFGSQMPGRAYTSSSGAYRFGFNGQEKDDEVSGSGNSYTAEFWQYDSRLGRRFNLDPKPNASISSYACFANNPVWFSDPYGDTIRVQFTDNDVRKKYISMINKYLGGQFAIKLVKVKDVEGYNEQVVLTAVKGGDYGKMTNKQKRFFEALTKGMSDKTTVRQSVVYKDATVEGGGYVYGTLDLADLENFDKNPIGTTGAEVVIHEVFEQLQKKKAGYRTGDWSAQGYQPAHDEAKKIEGYVGDYNRTENPDGSEDVKLNSGGTIKQNYSYDSKGNLDVTKKKRK